MDCYFVMSGPIGMNVGLFLEISVGFPISEAQQLFAKYNQSYVNQNIKYSPKFNTQQTLKVDSTLIYVEITSPRRSTWYPC